jgi:hypothetical protein
MTVVGAHAGYVLSIPVDGRHVPGDFGLQIRKLSKNKINYRPKCFFLRRVQGVQIVFNGTESWGFHFLPAPRANATVAFSWLWFVSGEGGHEEARRRLQHVVGSTFSE